MTENIGVVQETKSFEQLGILVLDGSGSMRAQGDTGIEKAAEVSIAVCDLISRLKHSKKKQNFYISIIYYDQNIEEHLSPIPIINANEIANYNPLVNHGGQTAIADALDKAYEIADQFLSGPTEFPRSAAIILMTDGQNTQGDPIDVANKIKNSGKKIFIHAVGYGKDTEIDKATLDSIVSNSGRISYTRDPESLRAFFMATMTQKQGE